jgi:hypothetical protein
MDQILLNGPSIESNSSVPTDELHILPVVDDVNITQLPVSELDTIRQLQLMNLDNFPAVSFLSISFTHH